MKANEKVKNIFEVIIFVALIVSSIITLIQLWFIWSQDVFGNGIITIFTFFGMIYYYELTWGKK